MWRERRVRHSYFVSQYSSRCPPSDSHPLHPSPLIVSRKSLSPLLLNPPLNVSEPRHSRGLPHIVLQGFTSSHGEVGLCRFHTLYISGHHIVYATAVINSGSGRTRRRGSRESRHGRFQEVQHFVLLRGPPLVGVFAGGGGEPHLLQLTRCTSGVTLVTRGRRIGTETTEHRSDLRHFIGEVLRGGFDKLLIEGVLNVGRLREGFEGRESFGRGYLSVFVDRLRVGANVWAKRRLRSDFGDWSLACEK